METGVGTMTGGRIKKIQPYLDSSEPFCLTYGDGVSNVDMCALVKWHEQQGTLATLTAVQPVGKFGAISTDQDKVSSFREKPQGEGRWINGGFFVVSPRVLDYIEGDQTSWEREPLERLAAAGELAAYRHTGFWQAMDTLYDKNYLDRLWNEGAAPWKIW